MTKIQNSKQLAFDLIWELDIEIWNLFGPILKSGGACNLLFPVYPDLGPYRVFGVYFIASKCFIFDTLLEMAAGSPAAILLRNPAITLK